MRDESKYLEPQGHHCKTPLKTKASFLLFKPSRFAFSVTRTSSLFYSLSALGFRSNFRTNSMVISFLKIWISILLNLSYLILKLCFSLRFLENSQEGGGNLEASIEQLLNVEKQMRLAGEVAGTKKAATDILQLCFEARAWKTLNDQIILLSKRRGQLKQVPQKFARSWIRGFFCCSVLNLSLFGLFV